MGIKKKDIDREYRKFFTVWLPKVTERLSVILYNVRDHSDLKEDDWEVLRTAYRWYHFGELSQFMPEVSPPKEQIVTQPELFSDNTAEKSQDVVVCPPTLVFGIDVDILPAQTKEKKK